MASIPTPDVAKGTAVGAKQGRSASEFHSGPFHDIRDFGAAMDGSTDDSGAIMDALQESASTGGAAYIPKGTAFAQGWRAVDVKSSMNGATLVGEGADSVIKGNKTPIAFYDSSHSDVTLANFRIDVSNGDWGIRTPNEVSDGGNPGTFDNMTFDNLWAHGASHNNLKFQPVGTGDNLIAEFRNISVWNTGEYHGMSLGNHNGNVTVKNLLSWNNGGPNGKGYGIDVSGQGAVIDGFLLVNNYKGTKTTSDGVRTEYRNGAILGCTSTGYLGAPNASGDVVFDRVLMRNCGGEGFSFRFANFHIPSKVWAVDNSAGPSEYAHGGVEYAYSPKIEANEIVVCGTQNDYPGVSDTTSDASGNVNKLIAWENSGGTFGSQGNVGYDSVQKESVEIPTVEEIVGTASGSNTASTHYHDGSGWQDATMRHYDGEQFVDVLVTQIGSN